MPNPIFLYPGEIFVNGQALDVITILGSCVAVCLWDPLAKVGGVNHYLLPLWNSKGIPSPRYGNIAIPKLIQNLLEIGAIKKRLEAKVFGGGSVMGSDKNQYNVASRNIVLAQSMLNNANIPIIAASVGQKFSRKILFNTATGKIKLRKSEGREL